MLSAIIALLEAEAPDIIAAVQRILPRVVAYFKSGGGVDGFIVAVDSAHEAHKRAVDAAIASETEK